MRLSDLLTYTVVDRAGTELGVVSDVRIVQDGPLVRGIQAAFRLDALVVGRGGLAERLGYIRTRVEGPWMLRVLFARLERSVKIVPVSAIERWDDSTQTIRLRDLSQPTRMVGAAVDL